jgi:hypothetical protein
VRMVDVKLRKCVICRTVMLRKTKPCGQFETPGRYVARKTCSRKCTDVMRQKARTSKRTCASESCGKLLTRKRRPSCIEPVQAFKRRRWCDMECRRKWYEETGWYAKQLADDAKPPCVQCDNNRRVSGSEMCRSCRWYAKRKDVAMKHAALVAAVYLVRLAA